MLGLGAQGAVGTNLWRRRDSMSRCRAQLRVRAGARRDALRPFVFVMAAPNLESIMTGAPSSAHPWTLARACAHAK